MEITVLCEDHRRAVLQADSNDLCIEHQVPGGSGLRRGITERKPISGARQEQSGGRTSEDPSEELERLLYRRRWTEDAGMGHDPQELPKSEDGDPPRRCALHEAPERRERKFMLERLLAMRVHQDVGVDRDQARSSMKS